jgi:hypothetical protein
MVKTTLFQYFNTTFTATVTWSEKAPKYLIVTATIQFVERQFQATIEIEVTNCGLHASNQQKVSF